MKTSSDNNLKKALAETMMEEENERKKKQQSMASRRADDTELHNLIVDDGDSELNDEFQSVIASAKHDKSGNREYNKDLTDMPW